MPPKLGAPCAAGLVAQFSPSPRSSAEHPVSKSSGEVKNQFLPMSETVSCPISALTLHRFPARRKICKPSDVFGNLEKKIKKSISRRPDPALDLQIRPIQPGLFSLCLSQGLTPQKGLRSPLGLTPNPASCSWGRATQHSGAHGNLPCAPLPAGACAGTFLGRIKAGSS